MKRLDVQETPIAGLKRIVSIRLGDMRGHFARVFCQDELIDAGWRQPVAQANITHTRHRGTVRGLHFQWPPHAEMKLVRCIRGMVWDVAVDLRRGSPTFLQWYAELLSGENLTALLIPQGFAHGFQALTDEVDLLYLHSAAHALGSEGGFHVNDPRLALPWPLPITMLSERDNSFPFITADYEGIDLL